MDTNVLYYGDNLDILRKYIPDNSVDLIYLDPPFNSKATYNVLFKEPTGEPSQAQITAFEDTWHWNVESERALQEVVASVTAPPSVKDLMSVLPKLLGKRTDMTAYLVMMCIRLLELRRVLKNTSSIYLHCDPTASHYLKILMDAIFGRENFRNEIIWLYKTGGTSKRYFSRKHDTILMYSKTGEWKFNPQKEKSYLMHKYGFSNINILEDDTGYYREVGMRDVWDIPALRGNQPEKLEYPTQKPEALLERIIKASSDKGDTVLDPFCGCGTALVVAHRLNRKWIGIDVTHLAISTMKWRLDKAFPGIQYKVIGEPKDLAGAEELANQNKYQFQWWAVSLIGGQPYGDKKKGADTGIDGYVYFMDEKDKVKKAIVSVKGGGTSVKDIRDLSGVIDREKAEMGIFLTLKEPTKPMEIEATMKGFYRSPLGADYPKMQILTIKELLDGKKPQIPPWIAPMQAPPTSKKREGKAVKML